MYTVYERAQLAAACLFLGKYSWGRECSPVTVQQILCATYVIDGAAKCDAQAMLFPYEYCTYVPKET